MKHLRPQVIIRPSQDGGAYVVIWMGAMEPKRYGSFEAALEAGWAGPAVHLTA